MSNRKIIQIICLCLSFSAFGLSGRAEPITNAIHAYLKRFVDSKPIKFGIVVGLVDEHGSSVVSYGKLDNGTDQDVNGNTVFEMGSVTKTFTALLLQDMIDRGEMKLDDPVAKYLPASVTLPTYNGKALTLFDLATQTSGFPHDPDNYDPKLADHPFADYSVERMYEYLSHYKLTRAPGTRFGYSNLGVGLLGHLMCLKAGTNFESFVMDRICRPLKMDSTRITLTPEMKGRFVQPHNPAGYAVPALDFGTLEGSGALRTTGNDMVKFMSAGLGFPPSGLTSSFEKTQQLHFHDPRANVGLVWWILQPIPGTTMVFHNGGTGGCSAWIGFDKARRRGVTILSSWRWFDIDNFGWYLLHAEWQSDHRPDGKKINRQVLDSYVGQYREPAARSGTAHTNKLPVIGIRREGDRLVADNKFVEGVWNTWLTAFPDELLPESETSFFDRLGGCRIAFSRDALGNVTGLTAHYPGNSFFCEKISNAPPNPPEPVKPIVPVKVDPKVLEPCVGQYQFPPGPGIPEGGTIAMSQEGGLLVWRATGKNFDTGAIYLYPESETNFFMEIYDNAQLTFVKNERGQATSIIHHVEGVPDKVLKRLPDPMR
ncbi:MAG TPA: serine hydrolase [Verrucomicrobiae bacterium]|jgi:CubicO group peptidase (beta-lactamase class C family)|nr:serine hydrolase [Verrucomicrobiae bacterium]